MTDEHAPIVTKWHWLRGWVPAHEPVATLPQLHRSEAKTVEPYRAADYANAAPSVGLGYAADDFDANWLRNMVYSPGLQGVPLRARAVNHGGPAR